MIELAIAKRIARRALVLGVLAFLVCWFLAGLTAALSAALGITFAVGNIYFAALVIGRIADSSPDLLMVGGMVALFTGLLALTLLGITLRNVEMISLPVLGVAALASHLALVLWEGARPSASEDGAMEESVKA